MKMKNKEQMKNNRIQTAAAAINKFLQKIRIHSAKYLNSQ